MAKPPPVTVRYADGRTEIVPARSITDRKFSYARYRMSPQWQTLRRKVLKREGYKCGYCKISNVRLDVHHLNYDRIGKERLEDLVALCQRCHATDHQWKQRLG